MSNPKISIRFSNPTYNPSTKKFKIDVEYSSDIPNTRVFGQNVRFFYDGAIFDNANPTNVKFTDFAPGYAPFSPYPNYMSNPTAGIAWFNLPTTALGYINSAIAINNINATPVLLSPDSWTKIFSIELTSRGVWSGDVYPVLIWDQEEISGNGGFINGNTGNTITHVVDPSGIIKTGPTSTIAKHFNWTQTAGTLKAPWGFPNTNNKFIVA